MSLARLLVGTHLAFHLRDAHHYVLASLQPIYQLQPDEMVAAHAYDTWPAITLLSSPSSSVLAPLPTSFSAFFVPVTVSRI
eukprot:COSAG01_NODE_2583_length_7421_cov_3.605163_1_plen_80_part_10